MRLTRVHCAEAVTENLRLALPEGPSRHLALVLRLAPGAPLRIFDGQGHEYDAVITAVGRRSVEVQTGTRFDSRSESPLQTTLLLGVSRGERMDVALQKATELGVSRIRPLLARRSSVRLKAGDLARRMEHWHGVVVGACEQSGRCRVPELLPALDIPAASEATPATSLRLVLAADATTGLVARITAAGGVADITLMVGPEGGLDPAEESIAVAAGFGACRLGPRVLRTETAPLAALAVIQALVGDLGS
ncbi:MAG: hypothetical protein RL026_1033 [Pseudomonadota bacterium]|jgi:16S rRNA (uracil1498-N3)-methyltransferase